MALVRVLLRGRLFRVFLTTGVVVARVTFLVVDARRTRKSRVHFKAVTKGRGRSE